MSKDFAVIKLDSKQFIIEQGSRLKVDRVSSDSQVEVLLAEIEGTLLIGTPIVEGVGVKLEVIEEKKDIKISVRRFKSKSRYRKHKGHRQPISILNVLKIGNKIKNELVYSTKENNEKPVLIEEKTSVEEMSTKEKTISEGERISDLDITDKMKATLIARGYKTVKDIKKASKKDLLSLKGIGEKTVEKLMSVCQLSK